MLVKCGGISTSLIRWSLISALSLTTGLWMVTGLGIRSMISPAGRNLANENISMNLKKSPGYSEVMSPCRARAMRLTLMYWPS